MVPKLQPTLSFKSIEGTFSRDPVRRLGKLVTISADGKYIFSICDAGGAHPEQQKEVASAAVYRTDGQAVSTQKFPSLVNCGSLSGDGTVAVAATENGLIHLWNGQTGKSLGTAGAPEKLKATCDIAITPRGETFASTSFRDDAVKVWDSADLRCSHTFPGVFEKRARSGLCSIQADGQRLFVCDYRAIHVLDFRQQQKAFSVGNSEMSALGGLGTFMSACDADRNGRTVAAVHWPRNQVCLWDMRMRKIRNVIKLLGNHGTGTVAITPDGSRMVCSVYPPEEKARLAVICDASNAKIIHKLNHSDARTIGSSISADGTTAVTLSKDGVTRVFDLNLTPAQVNKKVDIGTLRS